MIQRRPFKILALALLFSSCSTKYLKYDQEDKLKNNAEFDAVVKITSTEDRSADQKLDNKSVQTPTNQNENKSITTSKENLRTSKLKTTKKNKKAAIGSEVVGPAHREPDLEDEEGFTGRRPDKDPFRVGEKVVHHVKYFKMQAGTLTFKVDPFVQVNGRKSYSFVNEIKTASLFDSFYSVDDRALTLMDYDLLIPRVFTLHVKETGQLREARSLFDFDKLMATYWEKKVTEKNGAEEKKQQWEILPFSQNVFSAIYYMRTFKWDLGKTYSFRVADDETNIVFKGTAVRKETLDTAAGKFNAIVVKPEFTVKGVFKPVGDIFIWLSDDDRKLVLRIESKIKIGTLVSEIESYTPGN